MRVYVAVNQVMSHSITQIQVNLLARLPSILTRKGPKRIYRRREQREPETFFFGFEKGTKSHGTWSSPAHNEQHNQRSR